MSTNKLLQSLSEDPQLEKQIGCMAGILQLFDRHQVLTGRRLYGHKRISAAAPKAPNTPTSNCGSPASETSGTSSDLLVSSHVRLPSDNLKQKQPTSTGIIALSEPQKSQPLLPTVPSLISPTDVKSSSAYARTQCLAVSDASPHASSGDHLPKISFEMARSSMLTPRRLDSSRSLHEGRVNVSHEGKVFGRRSVDTAERAAAAARGALKELSRISADIGGPGHHPDQVSIRDIVRSSFVKEQQAPRSTANHSTSGLSAPQRTALAPRMSNEVGICPPKPALARDMSREQYAESAECNPSSRTMQVSNIHGPQANARMEGASRPPWQYKTKSDQAPTKSSADISESLKLLAKLREATPPYNSLLLKGEANTDHGGIQVQAAVNRIPRPPATLTRAIATESPVAFASRAPLPKAGDRIPGRTSCYEPARSSSVDALLQGGPRAKEIPRLSLDGRGSGAGIKVDREAGPMNGKMHYPRSLLSSRSVSCSNSDCDTESLHEKRASFSSNVVAKLMGLEEMPNEEMAEAAKPQNKLGPYGSSDPKCNSRMATSMMQDPNPTFSQCGKYVSASFFPSKRRDDICIVVDAEEEEEDCYIQMEPLSHQEARTLSVRVGSSNSQAGVLRLTTSEGGSNMGHPACFQPKNHHLMEDRPPHVLSPAARLCAQIEELQRADSVCKSVDRGFRTMEMQSSQQDLEALKQLLGAIHLNRENSHGAGLFSEKLEMKATTSRKEQLGSGQVAFPAQEQYTEQQVSPSAVIWKTKRMLNDELYARKYFQNSDNSKMPAESLNKKVKNIMQDPGSLPSCRQHGSSETYFPAPRTRAESRSSPAESHSSAFSTPRKTNSSNDCVTPTSTANANSANVSQRLASRTNTPPNRMSARFSTSSQTLPSQQSRQSYNSSYGWEASSVSSTSSCHAKDQHPILGNNSYHAAGKKNRQVESQERKKATTSIYKDKEESKSNLVSLKSSPNTPVEKRSTSVVGSKSANSRTVRRTTPLQNPDHVRSSMRSPTKSSSRKAEEVKRKLSFENRSPGKIRPPSEMESEYQDTEFMDKTMVSSINNRDPSTDYAHLDQNQSSKIRIEAGHDAEPISSASSHGNELRDTFIDATLTKTEVGVKSPALLSPCDNEETNLHTGLHVTASSFVRDHKERPIMQDMSSPVTPICTPVGPLKLPQVPQQENEDTESQEDKSTGSCEQPSPCSVLEGPFYEEDDVASPPTATKFVLKLEEMEDVDIDKDLNGQCGLARGSPRRSEYAPPCPPLRPDIHSCSKADFAYVTQLLDMATNSNDITRSKRSILTLRPLEPHCFLHLEEENLNNHGDAPTCKSEIGSMGRRRLLFDSVNTSLERRLRRWRVCQRQPWLLACERSLHGIMGRDCSPALQRGMIGLDEEKNVCLSREGGKVLLEEVWEEMGEMNKGLKGKRKKKWESVGTSAYEEEEETCDDVGRMLEEDMRGGPFHTSCPDSWATLLVEKGELGLDLERLIFKDLVDHTIRDLGLLILPTTKSQLLKVHNN